MVDAPILRLLFVDEEGNPFAGNVDIEVRHRRLAERITLRGVAASQPVDVTGVHGAPEGDYQVTITPSGRFERQSQFVNVPARGVVTVRFVLKGGGVGPDGGNGDDTAGDRTLLPELFHVSGTVAGSDRPAVPGLRVEIVDKSVGGDVLLAIAYTDRRGRYAAEFTSERIRERGKSSADLQARVHQGERFLAASAVRYDAAEREVLDVSLPADATGLASEHDLLLEAVLPHVRGSLADLVEDEQRQDVGYLANKSGWDARAVAMASLSEQFSRRSPAGTIDPSFYYTLFRSGLPADADALYRTPLATVKRIWENGIAGGVIPRSSEDDLPRALDEFTRLSARTLLDSAPRVGHSPLGEMLSASGLDPQTAQPRFAHIYATHRGDKNALWTEMAREFDEATALRLQVDGRLEFLTINNAPLVTAIHREAGGILADPVQLVHRGFHRAARWEGLLTSNTPIPAQIPGANADERKRNYADYLAAYVRLSYPTASVAKMVDDGELAITARTQVRDFLNAHHGKFELGLQPVEQYVNRNGVTIAPQTLADVKRIQRVYQLTTSDQALSGLLARKVDSAHQIVSMQREAFIGEFAGAVGGDDAAAKTYDRAVEIHNAVLNIAVAYVNASRGIELGAHRQAGVARGEFLQTKPKGPSGPDGANVIAYPTLEGLFGEMDFCACDHCRSVLSPAAYLVDLLMFLDREPGGGKANPQAVFLARRPDVQHLPLTCENTNTALPYIDVVNETLEYFVANGLNLANYAGHDTGDARAEDLLASPRFVMTSAYTALLGERFPIPLPFHRALENFRAYFDKFEVPLPLAMERLRRTDDFLRGTNEYGWLDVFIEELRLSRQEHEIFTSSTAVPLGRMYGFANDSDVAAKVTGAKKFTRHTGITYEALAAILRTRFVNPSSDLLPLFERLRVPISLIVELKTKNDQQTDAKFDAALPTGAAKVSPADYGGDIKQWAKNNTNYNRLLRIIVLTDPSTAPNPCNFDRLELRYLNPDNTANRLNAADFARLLRFIRLWRKTGWTIEQTDAAICAFYRNDRQPPADTDLDTLAKLDAGLREVLPRLGVLMRVVQRLGLDVQRDLGPLLTLWTDIPLHGEQSLYRRMFLNPTILERNPVFAPNLNGAVLTDGTVKLAAHAEALRSAFNISGEELEQILASLGYQGNVTPLSLPNISAIHRRAWLARRLRISVRELLKLIEVTGVDPFAAPDFAGSPPQLPPILRFIDLVQLLQERSLKIATALDLVWSQDLSGKSAPDTAAITELLRALRGAFAEIDSQLAVTEDPSGDVVRARMTLVHGEETAQAFMALLEDTIVVDAPYTHGTDTLPQPVTALDPAIAYDPLRHLLSHTGLLSATMRNGLKALNVSSGFNTAVDALFARGEDAKDALFKRNSELKPLYDAYVASNAPPAEKRATLLKAFNPELARRRKQQEALQRFSAATGAELPFTKAVIAAEAAPFALHAAGDPARPALDDLLGAGTHGWKAEFYFRATATAPIDLTIPAAANLDYAPVTNPLPNAPNPVSAVWTGRLEPVESGFHNLIVEADSPATVKVELDGNVVALKQNGPLWRNDAALELQGGVLYPIKVTVENVLNRVSIQWEAPKRPREVIPGRYLCPPSVFAPFTSLYLRFVKAAAIANALLLTAEELVHFATGADDRIDGDGWLNALPVQSTLAAGLGPKLAGSFRSLLEFSQIKAAVSPGDDQVLAALETPGKAGEIMQWDPASLAAFLQRFNTTPDKLAKLAVFRRVYEAFGVMRTMGISAAALLKATNDPSDADVAALQSSLRARYEEADWRAVVQPINDRMRALQRDALVAYVLHRFRGDTNKEHIDTPDKLFEYFLMDVQMEPCMQTSRVRHALSSVQLFIERCLMNLETEVAPALMNASQWQWMKRYRVWEANRKVFLFPENWLEPELRDDKSPFFKEIESELLQSDITEDSAAAAVLNYLAKLEEVAKLEPCGVAVVEPAPQNRSETVHVIAHTSGAGRKHYSRRRQHGSWTPWEQIRLEVEDPALPVVWKGRLLLFWPRLMKQGTPAGSPPPRDPNRKLIDLNTAEIPGPPSVGTNVILCWSEYHNGKWQPAKTSDPSQPRYLASYEVNASSLQLRTDVDSEGSLIVQIDGGNAPVAFKLFNTHSTPVYTPALSNVIGGSARRFWAYGIGLGFVCYGMTYFSGTEVLHRPFICPEDLVRITEPRQPLAKPWNAPFLISDSKAALYFDTTDKLVSLWDYPDYGFVTDYDLTDHINLPGLVVRDPKLAIPPVVDWGDSGPGDPGVVNPGPLRQFVTEDVYIRTGLGSTGRVRFGSVDIGPQGAILKGGK